MTSDIEMKTLWSQRTPQTSAGEDIDEENDSGISTWAIFTAGIFFLVALCFIGSPRLLLFLSETTPTVDRRMTPLEYFLAVHFGILLISVSAALILNIPHDSATSHPLLAPISCACAVGSIASFNTNNVGSLSGILSFTSGVVSIWGLWVLVFGAPQRSKTTGADKRTSAFMFGNKSAASKQKEEWRNGHKEE